MDLPKAAYGSFQKDQFRGPIHALVEHKGAVRDPGKIALHAPGPPKGGGHDQDGHLRRRGPNAVDVRPGPLAVGKNVVELVHHETNPRTPRVFQGIDLLGTAEHRSLFVFLEVPRLQPHVEPQGAQVQIALVGEGLDGSGEDHPLRGGVDPPLPIQDARPKIGHPGLPRPRGGRQHSALARQAIRRRELPTVKRSTFFHGRASIGSHGESVARHSPSSQKKLDKGENNWYSSTRLEVSPWLA
ncbi:MAG: hypothetical protein BWY88_01085 [Synergistetes bacterium ADurb.Bin520]|nr:MAG: hypothetical protein BWY88_01085 [Synergistetes bacterium ADurb.Bin520]